jgi:hypothetical protein
MMGLSADAKVVSLPSFSVRNTNSAAETVVWKIAVDARPYADIYAKVVLGLTWNASDDLTTCKLQQCTAVDGTGAKDLTTSSATGGYDTDTPVDALGNSVVLEARVADMDMENGFYYVRVYAASTGNTGTDECHGVLILYNAREKAANKEAAAAAGEVVYLTSRD